MTTRTFQFTVSDQHIKLTTDVAASPPVSDTKGYLTARFTFDHTWNDTTRLGVFIGSRGGTSVCNVCTVELDADGSCIIPAEVLTADNRILQVGALGYTDGGARLTTDTCLIPQQKSCFRDQKSPPPPTPDLYAVMLASAAEARTSAMDAHASAAEAEAIAHRMETNAADGLYNGSDGLTPHIGQNGNWWLGDTDTTLPSRGPQGERGEAGISGLQPLQDIGSPESTVLILPANTMTVITPTMIHGFVLGSGIAGLDNEWGLTIMMGNTAHTLSLPATKWTLGIAPTFAAGTTTVCRFYYVGNTLCGEWVCI